MLFFLRVTQCVLQTIDSSPDCALSSCTPHTLPKTKTPNMTKVRIPITSKRWFFSFIILLKISQFCKPWD